MSEKKESRYQSVSIQVNKHDWKNMKLLAEQEDTSINHQARKAVKAYLTEQFKNKGLI